jgi:hypothetical protein
MFSLAVRMVVTIAFAFGAAMVSTATWADCGCGPLYCKNDPTFPAALAKKKKALSSAGYPDRLIALLDKGGQCLVCVGSGSPDIFTLLPPTKNDQGQVVLNPVPWDEDNERIANDHLRSGEIKSYYIYNIRKACTCCGEPKAENRDDYDSDLELNRNTSLKCVKANDGKIACN